MAVPPALGFPAVIAFLQQLLQAFPADAHANQKRSSKPCQCQRHAQGGDHRHGAFGNEQRQGGQDAQAHAHNVPPPVTLPAAFLLFTGHLDHAACGLNRFFFQILVAFGSSPAGHEHCHRTRRQHKQRCDSHRACHIFREPARLGQSTQHKQRNGRQHTGKHRPGNAVRHRFL